MLGNLSQTVIKVPNFFNLLTKLSSYEFQKTRYREPPLLDTFSQLKKINSHPNKRYFRLNDHFKANAPYKDLNYNNNKRFISPITKLPLRSFEQFFCPEYNNKLNQNLKTNNSQDELITISINNPKFNLDKTTSNNTNGKFKIENNRYNQIIPINIEEQKLPDIKENLNNNLKELKEYLELKYIDETKKTTLPKIRRIHKSMSQDDLFKKTIDKKIGSLSVINPIAKDSLYKRKKNMILKRDYDLLQKIYSNHNN